MTDFNTMDGIARQLCEAAGRDYDAPGCKKNHWRRKARALIERERGIATADALMGIFGLRRVK